MRIILLLGIIAFLSCRSKEGTKKKDDQQKLDGSDSKSVQKKDSAKVTSVTASPSFLDSISKKYDLTITQIRRHTIIDSGYFTGTFSDVAFTGDTVFTFHNTFKAAIINYDDRKNCLYKFLLIFTSEGIQNTDSKEIFTDCDRDESSGFFSLKYKLLNDSIFQTIRSYTPANSEKVTERKKLNWNITDRGIIDSINQQ